MCFPEILAHSSFENYIRNRGLFDEFDLSWLYNFPPKSYEKIITNDMVKQKLRSMIADAINSREQNPSDEKS